MKNAARVSLIAAVIFLPAFCFAQSNLTESLTITTYYPSPYGVYRNLKLSPTTTVPNDSALSAGVMYYDNNPGMGMIRYYNSTGKWVNLTEGSGGGGVAGGWEHNTTTGHVYNVNTGNIGIGTNNPSRKLTIVGTATDLVKLQLRGPHPDFELVDTQVPSGVQISNDGNLLEVLKDNAGDSGFSSTSYLMAIHIPSGNVGIGTSSPAKKLVIGDDSDNNFRCGPPADGLGIAFRNQAGLWIHNTASDVETMLESSNWDGPTNNPAVRFGSVTNHALIFYTDNTKKMTILPNGNVGIGQGNPSTYKLDVDGNIRHTGTCSTSDRRWKKNIIPLSDALKRIVKLQGVNYEWDKEDFPDHGFMDGRQIGIVAQDAERVIPELVSTDSQGYKSFNYEKLTVVLVEAVKEQQGQIKEQHRQLESLKQEIQTLKARK